MKMYNLKIQNSKFKIQDSVIFFLILNLFLLSKNLYSAFKDVGFGVRALGMGGAFVAVSDDANAMIYNPAGLGQMYYRHAEFMYGKPYVGLEGVDIEYYYLAFGMKPVPRISYGISYTNFTTRDLYREDTLSLAICYTPKFSRRNRNFWYSAGMTLKMLYHGYEPDEYTIDDPVFSSGRDKYALSLDLGILTKFYNKLRIGLVVKDIVEPDVGLKDEDKVPYTLKLGSSYFHRFAGYKFLYTIDFTYRNQEYDIAGGIEWYVADENFRIRFGGNLTELTSGINYGFDLTSKIFIEINYGFVFPIYIKDSYGSHRISFGIKF